MVEKTLGDEIVIIVDDRISRLPVNLECTISKVYSDGFVDVIANDETLTYIKCIGSPKKNEKGVVVFIENDFNNPIVICKSNDGGGGDLSNYYTKTEINGILSSYVTNQTLEDYALKSELFSGSYNDLTDVPSSFPPSSHNHTISQITDLNIPTKTSDLTNDGADGINIFVSDNDSRLSDARTPTSHNHDDRYYTESEIDYALNGKSSTGHTHDDRYYTESEINSAMLNKQDRLVSQVNIKSINGNSLMGSGDLAVGDVTQNVVTEWSDPVTDGHIPSERLVYNSLANKASWAHTHYSHDITDLIDVVYPVGSIYMSVSNVNPATLFGVGTWVRIEDRFLLASGSSYPATYDNDGFANKTDGEASHSLTKSEMPRHTHTQNEHNHTQNQHRHGLGSDWSSGSGSQGAFSYDSNHSRTSKYTAYSTPTNNPTTATNQYTGGSGSAQSESNGVAHNNMPPYLIVNVWKRTA